MNEETPYHECLYCNAELPGVPDEDEQPPEVNDEAAWAEEAGQHATV